MEVSPISRSEGKGLVSRLSGRPYALAIVLIAIGTILTWLGAQLAMLGGSFYYVLVGLTLILAGGLALRGSRWSPRLYGAALLATIGWALFEVGLDGWALIPRLVGPAVLGIWFLMPWVRRSFAKDRVGADSGAWLNGDRLGLILVIAAFILVGVGVAWASTRPVTALPLGQARSIGASTADGDWLHYGNAQGGTRFSPLDQITPENVDRLEIAWTAHLGTGRGGVHAMVEGTPLKIGDTVYACNGFNDVSALDAETGRLRWKHDAGVDPKFVFHPVCRGISYYQVPGASGACAQRIYTATVDGRLIALDSRTGGLCRDFGVNGAVDLMSGMGPGPRGYYYVTSPPQLVRGRLVVGGAVLDGQYRNEVSGVIRAFDAVNGRLAWAWDMGRPGHTTAPEPGRIFTPGTANSWAPMSADEALGLVYVPTGNGNPDYYGGFRTPEVEKYSVSVVAIDAATGLPRWSYQTTHHDLWDYDNASQPTLVDFPAGSGTLPGLILPTKRGELFVLDRRTGRPLVDTREMPVPQGGIVPGERLSPTQPFSVGMPSFKGPDITERDMWGISPIDQALCRIMFRKARYEGSMTPPGLRPTLASPGYVGGMDWGGVSYDPSRQLLIFPANRFANHAQIITRPEANGLGLKPALHGGVVNLVKGHPQAGTPFAMVVGSFLSPIYMPCQRPPYGTLNAVDLKTRKLVWTRPVGLAADLGPLGIPSQLPFTIGTPLTGGALLTRSGLTFMGATTDRRFRAFDSRTGRLLWQAAVPASALASPMTYRSPSGRQIVVVAAANGKYMPGPVSDELIAFALPRTASR